MVNSNRDEPPKPPCRFAPRDHNIYAHICRGKWRRCNLHTRTWENSARFFSCRSIICTVYCWEKCKNCKVRSCLCALDPSIFHFIWAKHGGKIWQLEPSNRICKKMEIAWEVGNCADYTIQARVSCAYCTIALWRHTSPVTARTKKAYRNIGKQRKTRQRLASGFVKCIAYHS